MNMNDFSYMLTVFAYVFRSLLGVFRHNTATSSAVMAWLCECVCMTERKEKEKRRNRLRERE